MMSRIPQLLAGAMALLVGLSAPCAAALLPAPASCSMARCGDGLSMAAPRPSCCCSPDGAQTDSTPAASLITKVFVGNDFQAVEDAACASLPGGDLDGLIPHPPTAVPLYLLHSALLN